MERKGVLILATPALLLAIDPASLTTSPEKDLVSQMPPPPVIKMLNLMKNGFPFGMRFFVRESKLYMIGGEKPVEGLTLSELFSGPGTYVDKSFGIRGASPYIYVSDLNTPDSITDLRKLPTTMLGPKPNPFIAEVEGKIYVLSGHPYLYPLVDILFPTFEVYDPSVGQWEALPDPPFYNPKTWPKTVKKVQAISVMGTTIYVKPDKNYYSYNVHTKIWDSLVSDSPLLQPILPEFQPGKFVRAYDDIFIGLQRHALFAALIPRDGSPPTYQILDEVFDEYYNYAFWSDSGAVIDMGEKEMCVIKAGIWEEIHSSAYIATFRVEKMHSSAQIPEPAVSSAQSSSASAPKRAKTTADSAPVQDGDQRARFLSVTCLTKGFYNLNAWGPELPTICGAFFQSWSVFNLSLSVHFYIIIHCFVSIPIYNC